MRFVLSLLLLLVAAPLGPSALSAGTPAIESPAKGTDLRKQLLDAARAVFERELGAPVEFVVTTLNVIDGWGNVKPQRPGGAPIDWRRTKFADAFKDGIFEAEISLFLLQKTTDGWQLVEYAIGPTDVAWLPWREQRTLPYELFGASPGDFTE
ncbi:hypothetical protein [Hyphomicrobium sp. CS1GBMeth3]|uniref:hypothetical protein n=1 Tax=Hyphomicrobium sp. CS1GBMeth3 TaxID=1892845 RepID=UPI00092FF0AE|nr:hypothetical protein [Hyphomicrobium sp. CS1GBMeth3]